MNGFDVGALYASLTLEGVEQFHRELDSAGRKLTDTGQRGASFGRAAEAAVRTAAGATTGLVTAATAYLTILTKTGVAYNSLQQNSRAALGVLLGGSEQANEQMAKLDAFARNSPFSKSVFISAQQQLIGFGIEARKAIPYLDALQQAVAATGGSNARLEALVDIMAKIQSSAKITAVDLMQFGNHGVDAATLIGSQMGKTGAEIRDEISDGVLDASLALDALAAGMQERFGGATAKVKEQWSGAVDRMKAAQRDLGSVIAEPFVSAQGGGMAVTWGNQVANVLRAIEKQAVPVMGILTQRGMPFFASFTQDLDSAQAAVQRWNPASLEQSLDRMAGHAPAIAALAGAVLALGAQVGPLGKLLTTLNISVNPVVAALVAMAAASPEVRESLKGVLEAGKPLLPILGEIATILSGTLNSALPLVAGGVEIFAGALRIVVGLFEKIPTPVLAGVAAFLALHKVTGGLDLGVVNAGLKTFLEGIRNSESVRAFNAGLTPTSALLAGVGSASRTASGAVAGLGNAMKTAFLSNPIGIALTVVSVAIGAWAALNAQAQQRVEEHRNRVVALKDSLNQTTGALTEATRAVIEKNIADSEVLETASKIGLSQETVVRALMGESNAIAELTAATEKYRGEQAMQLSLYDDVNRAGLTFVERFDEQVASVEEARRAVREKTQADRDAAAAMSEAERSNQRFNEALEVARDITKDAETRVRALKQALDELQGGAISAEEAEKRLSETNLTLAEGLAQSNEEGVKLWQSVLDGAGSIDLGSRSGLAFADAMGRSRDAMLDAAMAASDQALKNGDLAGAVDAATSAGNRYIDTLRQTMTDANLTEEQINGLIGTYLDVPSVVATLLTDNGSISEADQKLLGMLDKLALIEHGSTVTVEDPDSPEVIRRLEGLGYLVDHLPDGTINITSTGEQRVRDVLAELTKPRVSVVDILYQEGARPQLGPVLNHQGGHYAGGVRQFDQGGFASGIYAGVPGGIPKMGVDGSLHLFAEKHLGVDWETYISSKASKARNAALLMETSRRIGFPMVPMSALRGIQGYDQGGTVSRTTTLPQPADVAGGQTTNWNMTIVNPVVRDPFEDAWEQAQEKGGF